MGQNCISGRNDDNLSDLESTALGVDQRIDFNPSSSMHTLSPLVLVVEKKIAPSGTIKDPARNLCLCYS